MTSDRITVNLRGSTFVLERSVYMDKAGSKLTRLVSGCGGEGGGEVYIDRNPALFPYVLGK